MRRCARRHIASVHVVGDATGFRRTVAARADALPANIETYGSRQLGREIASIRGEAYGLTGLDDRTSRSFASSFR